MHSHNFYVDFFNRNYYRGLSAQLHARDPVGVLTSPLVWAMPDQANDITTIIPYSGNG